MANSRKLWMVAAFTVIFAVMAPAQEKPVNVTGKWEMTWEGRRKGVTQLTFAQDGEKLKGTIARPGGEVAFTGTVKGNTITFTVERDTPRGKEIAEYKGTVDGKSIKGTITVLGGRTIPWTAKPWTI